MPGVPAWYCDFCGEMVYDGEIMMRLVMLLGPESDLEDQRRWRVTGREEDWAADFGDRRRMR